MKGLLIISFLVLALLYGTARAQDQCSRAVITNEQVTVNVNWCSVPATATLPEFGYCANARCMSSHKTHSTPEQVVPGS